MIASNVYLAWLLVVLAGVLSTLGNLCLKKSSNEAEGVFAILMHPFFLSGMFFYGINVVLFAKALQSLAVSKAYPVLAAVGFTSLSIAAFFIFKENLSPANYIGIMVILVGIFLLST